MSTRWADAGRDISGRRRLINTTDVVATKMDDGRWELRAAFDALSVDDARS